MKLSENILEMIDQDINKIEKALKTKSDLTLLHIEIDGKYQNFFPTWGSGMYGYMTDVGFNYDCIDAYHNLSLMLNKLKALRAYGYPFTSESAMNSISPTFNNNVDVQVDVNFSDVRKEIGNMGALTEAEIQEIFEKIDELETIVKSDDRKPVKWEKAKQIAKWVLDKSVDVAIAFLPLLLQLK